MSLNENKMSEYDSVQIIDDSDEETNNKGELKGTNENTSVEIKEEKEEKEVKKKRKPRTKKIVDLLEKKEEPTLIIPDCILKKFYHLDHTLEIGADEAGRGPMFGRVYSGAVILPKDDSFDHFKMKDSKKFTSKNTKKINEVAEYIKEHAIAWAVEYEDEKVIDEINILQATQSAMHKAIKSVINQLHKNSQYSLENNMDNLLLLIDGNYFKQLTILNKTKTKLVTIKCETIEGGDNKYTSIAAASILAKVERDKYIGELCLENPELVERYGIDSNKGYGSKRHMDGIKKYGITKWHRRTFGICATFS